MLIPSLMVALAATFGLASLVHADILIGLALPFTGPNAWLGEQTERGVALAVADLNAAGGLLGQQVEVVTADDYCDGEQAVAAASCPSEPAMATWVRRLALLAEKITH